MKIYRIDPFGTIMMDKTCHCYGYLLVTMVTPPAVYADKTQLLKNTGFCLTADNASGERNQSRQETEIYLPSLSFKLNL